MMKVSVIGAGNVGGTLAQRIAESGLSDVVLVDIADGVPQGKGFDLADARSIIGNDCKVEGTTDYSKISGSKVVVVTAGLPRQPGMSREDLVAKNAATIKKVLSEVVKYASDTILLIVTNPLDILTNIALKTSGFEPNRVIGMGGVLDSSRFANLIAEELNVSINDVKALVIGAHGQGMIPLVSQSSVSGKTLSEVLPKEKVDALVEDTVKRGAQIVACLGKGSAYYAPSAAAFSMVKAILKDEKKVVPASVLLSGQYGLTDVCIGVPVCLGTSGIEEIIELPLTDEEKKQLIDSAESIRSTLTNLL
ncbi:MAG: malate dehydrogenase [PVC group bacterium]|nr:malate dehydrogenase [PVC group bacterium]